MAKLDMFLEAEVSVPEERKGKQIAVKESNITSLKEFYNQNYIQKSNPSVGDVVEPIVNTSALNIDALTNNIPAEPVVENVITPNPEPIPEPVISPVEPIVEVATPVIETPIIQSEPVMNEPINMDNETTSNGEGINLVLDNEEMDPELKEIKERLDKVINDLDNYKKKIKKLEEEVNQNLEKSREVLKDTQAAAKIMSIQQERQKQIQEEVSNGGEPIIDPTRVLQKDSAL